MCRKISPLNSLKIPHEHNLSMSMNVIGDLMIHGKQFVLLGYIVYIPISTNGTILLLNTKLTFYHGLRHVLQYAHVHCMLQLSHT
jgi:hypothetical protein